MNVVVINIKLALTTILGAIIIKMVIVKMVGAIVQSQKAQIGNANVYVKRKKLALVNALAKKKKQNAQEG